MVKITFDLDADQAAALFRLCEKITHSDASAYLYPHLPKEVRDEQASTMLAAAEQVREALADQGVSGWPWIETGRARKG